MHQLNRRQLLASSAIALLLSSRVARAATGEGRLALEARRADPPTAVTPDGWHYFTPAEAATVEAFVDRLIPPDPRNAGRQGLRLRRLYRPPACRSLRPQRSLLHDGAVPGGHQAARPAIGADPPRSNTARRSPRSTRPAAHKFSGKTFAALSDAEKDDVITGLENGIVQLDGYDGKTSSPRSSRIRSRVSSPTRSMAATATWRPGR